MSTLDTRRARGSYSGERRHRPTNSLAVVAGCCILLPMAYATEVSTYWACGDLRAALVHEVGHLLALDNRLNSDAYSSSVTFTHPPTPRPTPRTRLPFSTALTHRRGRRCAGHSCRERAGCDALLQTLVANLLAGWDSIKTERLQIKTALLRPSPSTSQLEVRSMSIRRLPAGTQPFSQTEQTDKLANHISV